MSAASLDGPTLLAVFHALPGAYLLLSPELIIEAVSEAYLAETLTERGQLVGRYLFDVFPDNPQAPLAHAVRNLRASLAQVLATGQPHQMAVQHYDVPDPQQPGQFAARYWRPTNTPIRDAQGRVRHLLHSVVNVTDQHLTQMRADQLVRATLDSSTAIIQVFDAVRDAGGRIVDFRWTLVNERAAAQYEADPVGQRLLALNPGVVEAGIFARFVQVVESGQPLVYEQEYRYEQYDGWFEQSVVKLGDGVVSTTTDITARKQAEEALRAAHAHTVDILESTTDAFYALDAEFRFTYVNQRAARLWGRDQGELLGRHYWTEFPAAVGSDSYRQHYQVLQTGQPAHYETVSPLLGIWIDTIIYPGREGGLSVFFRDVTARKQAEAGLRTSQAQLAAVFEALPVGVGVMDTAGRLTLANGQMQQYLPGGVVPSRDETQSPRWRAYYPDGRPLPRSEFPGARALRGEKVVPGTEMLYTQDDGTEVWTQVSSVPLPDHQGNVTGHVSVIVDIDALKRAEQARQASEQRLRALMENLPGGAVFVVDKELRYQLAEGEALRQAGLAPADLLGRTVRQVVPPALWDQHEANYRAALGGQPFVVELTTYGRTFLTRGIPLRDASGQVEAVLAVSYDITDRQQAETALRQSQQQLQAFNEQLTRTNVDLDNFIYTASHDLKAPITNIEGLIYALQAQLPAPVQQTYDVGPLLDMMAAAVQRFLRTIEHLSDVVKLQQAHEAELTEVALLPVIEDVRRDLRPQLAAAGAQVDLDVQGCPAVQFSPKNLRSVVYNLLSNAVKYRHPDRPPRVRIACHQQEPYTVLSVADNGLGLEPSRQAELFTMFRRFHAHVEGSGIGLFMVKRIVENAGGRVEVRSTLGEGTTFFVYFRRTPVQPESVAASS